MQAALRLPEVTLSQPIEWLGLSFRVPEDWEIVRHGLSPEQGSLVFIDRRQQRLTVSWTQCRSEPDLNRLVTDYKSKELEATQQGKSRFESLRFGRFRGLIEHREDGECRRRAVYFDAKTSRLVEVLLVEPPGSEEELLPALLDTFSVTESGRTAVSWCAFGLRVTTPPGFRLAHTTVLPADTTFHFVEVDTKTGTDTRREATLRRRGMAAAWHRGDLKQLLEKQVPGVRFARVEELDHHGSPAALAEGVEPGPPFKRWLGQLRVLRVLAVHHSEVNAVYELKTLSSKKQPLLPEAFEFGGVEEAR